MKKGLMMLGVAAIALASCTQNEVVDVVESRAIGFDAFVGNSTKAVTDITKKDLTKFYVFGDYGEGASVAFSNTEVEGTNGNPYIPKNPAYWKTGENYTFGAYADGKNGGKLSGQEGENGTATFTNGTLTISGYSVNDANDLIAATANATGPAAGQEQSVALTFKHLLSKVKFTFSTTASPEAYRMEVSDLTFNGIKTAAKCVFSNNDISTNWTGTPGDYTIPTLSDYAVTDGKASTEDILVIPQANTTIEASFTVTIYDEETYDDSEDAVNTPIATNDFTAQLNTTDGWKAGYVYNYTATINPDKVDGNMKPITFTTDVTPWEDPTEQPVTPNVKP